MSQEPVTPSSPPAHLLRHLSRWGLGLAALLLVSTTVVFVDETEFVIVARFGRIVSVYDRSEQRGLQFKWPWPLETVRRFDRRLQLLSPAGREAFTHDRKNVTVEAYVLWRVGDGNSQDLSSHPVVRFFQSLGSVEVADARLSSRLQSILTERIGRIELTELLGARDSDAAPPDSPGALERVSRQIRRELMQRIDESVPTSKTPSSVSVCHLASSLSGSDQSCLVSARRVAAPRHVASRPTMSQAGRSDFVFTMQVNLKGAKTVFIMARRRGIGNTQSCVSPPGSGASPASANCGRGFTPRHVAG